MKYKIGEEANDICCCKCGEPMMVYDIDYHFSGCYDIYTTCKVIYCGSKCSTSATAYCRYGKIQKIEYYDDEDIIKIVKFNTSNLDGSEFD